MQRFKLVMTGTTSSYQLIVRFLSRCFDNLKHGNAIAERQLLILKWSKKVLNPPYASCAFNHD